MEATGRDGGRGPSLLWSYRRHGKTGTGSSSYTTSCSSRSGTIVSSTAHTSSSCRLSFGTSMEADWQINWELEHGLGLDTTDENDVEFAQPIEKPRKETEETLGTSMEAALQMNLELELRLGTPDEKDAEFAQPIKKPRKETEETLKELRMKHIESLVQEFFLGGCGGISALERWFSELGVRWVLQLDASGASAWVLRHLKAGDKFSWIRALTQIMETIHLTESLFPDHGHGFVGMPGISEEEVDSVKQATSLDPLQFALFFQKTMAKMLVFVDFLFSKSICIEGVGLEDTSSVSLRYCFDVIRALSEALLGIRLQFHLSYPAEVEKIEKEMVSLLSAKQEKAFQATWSALEEKRTRVLKSMEDSLGAETPQGSSDIHLATCLVMNHIKYLMYECWTDPLLLETKPFISMTTEMVFCLEEKLITKSQSFLDKGLGLLFLLNNSNLQLQDTHSNIKANLPAVISFITRKVEHCTESYIQVSWEPMLACMVNPTPLRLVRKYSPLSKFESEFQKIHSTQMLWKVPDPELRKRLRKAIIGKIIPAYTKYIEDNKVNNPKFTPQELEEMLQELFEG